jgi:8-oxo-dGTP diphosphatase
MLAHNKSGWTLLEYLKVSEDDIGAFENVTGAFAVISVNGEYLIGFNSWRQQWEFPAGGIELGETARDAAIRELYEETHQRQTDLEFKGLFKIKDSRGTIKYQAVFYGTMPALAPFSHIAEDEMDKIRLWDLKEDIGYVDECDLKIVELVTGNMKITSNTFSVDTSSSL